MKRLVFSILIVILPLFVLVPSPSCYGHQDITISVLPDSLKVVNKFAFSETAMEYIVFPEGFLYLSNNVFQNVRTLKGIYLPASTEYISDSEFSSNLGVVIYGVEDSYVDEWAHNHGILFFPCEALLAYQVVNLKPCYESNNKTRFTVLIRDKYKTYKCSFSPHSWLIRDMRPKKRRELHPIEEWFP